VTAQLFGVLPLIISILRALSHERNRIFLPDKSDFFLLLFRIPGGLGHRLKRREMHPMKSFNHMKGFRAGKGSGRCGTRGIVFGLAAALGLTALLVCALSLAVAREKLALNVGLSFAPLLPLPGIVLGCWLAGRLSGGGHGTASGITAGSVAALWLLGSFILRGRAGERWIPFAVCAGGWLLALLMASRGRRRGGAGMRKLRL
jgi:hypothetical protein